MEGQFEIKYNPEGKDLPDRIGISHERADIIARAVKAVVEDAVVPLEGLGFALKLDSASALHKLSKVAQSPAELLLIGWTYNHFIEDLKVTERAKSSMVIDLSKLVGNEKGDQILQALSEIADRKRKGQGNQSE